MHQIWQVILKLIGTISIALLIWSVIMMMRTVRRDQWVRLWSLFLPLVMAPAMLLVYVVLLNVHVHAVVSWLLLAAGLAVGIVWSRATTMHVRGPRVYGRRSAWYLAIWALTFAYTQAVTWFDSSGSLTKYGLATIFLSTGLAVGTNFGLIVMRQAVLARAGAPSSGPEPAVAAPPAPGDDDLARPAAEAICPACGRPVRAGQRFCAGCGHAVGG